MPVTSALAAVAVADLGPAKEFWTRVLGRGPDLEPMPSLAQWDLEAGGSLQVVQDAVRTGSSMVTLVVDDLDEALAGLAEDGVETGGTVDGVLSRLAQLEDPCGNLVTLVEQPSGS